MHKSCASDDSNRGQSPFDDVSSTQEEPDSNLSRFAYRRTGSLPRQLGKDSCGEADVQTLIVMRVCSFRVR